MIHFITTFIARHPVVTFFLITGLADTAAAISQSGNNTQATEEEKEGTNE